MLAGLCVTGIALAAAGQSYTVSVNETSMALVAQSLQKNIKVTNSTSSKIINVGVMWDNGVYDGLYTLSTGSGNTKTFKAPAGATRGDVYAFAAPGYGTFSAKIYVSYGN